MSGATPDLQHAAWKRDLFDRGAATFGRGPLAFFWEFGRQLVAFAQPRLSELAVDVAAGTGAVAVPLAAAGARVMAIDLSAPMLGQLQMAALAQPPWPVQGVAQALPCAAGAASVLTSGFGIAFFPNLPAALAEWRRVLRPDGRLALSWWMYDAPTPAVELWTMGAERSAEARRSWMHARALAAPDLVRNLVVQAGFPTARVERLRVDWNAGQFGPYWQRWVAQWADGPMPLLAGEEVAFRRRLEEVAARWTDPSGELRYPLEAFAVVA